MEFENLNRFDEDNKWELILKGLIHSVKHNSNFEDDDKILSIFESLDLDFREKKAIQLYGELWKIAYRRGKIQLSKEYANFYINYLLEYKRIPQLVLLQHEFKKSGFKKSYERASNFEELVGKREIKESTAEYYPNLHPELFRYSKEKLKKYLTEVEEWDSEDWKLCYEFIIRFYFDSDIFLKLHQHAKALNKSQYFTKLQVLLKEKNIIIPKDAETSKKKPSVGTEQTALDYDQMALGLISGVVRPDVYEQKRILVFINQMSDEEIISRGKDMSIAFNFLGMDLVVAKLCKRIAPLVSDLKEQISLYFILAESLLNSREYYEVVELCNELISGKPLNNDELLAFEYLLAESYFFLGKTDRAKGIFKRLMKKNPNYRMVAMRIRALESSK